jgi:hypothetical protein
MPVTRDRPAPYAPAKTVVEIINRFRQRGLPTPIDNETLGRVSVPETLVPRLIQSLRTLDLVTDDGQPTPTFEGLRLAPEVEYKKRLEDWLKGTYADIFAFVDPTKDDVTRIRDAFRSYQPVGQQARMVLLFQGLCAAAGLTSEKPARASASSSSPTPPSRPRPTSTARRPGQERVPVRHHVGPAVSDLPPALIGLLASLPAEGWTAARKAKFMVAFGNVLDLCFPILDEDRATEPNDEEAA